MKKLIPLLLALVMLFALAACGDKNPTPSGGTDGPGNLQQTESPGNDELPPAGKLQVKTEGNKVITTLNDGLGTLTVTEYIYKNNALDEIAVTIQCANETTAKTVYDSMKSGELKSTADASYSEFRQDGKNIICKMNDGMKAAFAGLSQSDLAATLSGGTPSGGGQSGGETGGKTTVNKKWEDLSLPSGFPKLYEGVTSHSEISAESFSLNWDVLPRVDADEMIKKLETWTGAAADKSEMDGTAFWTISSGNTNITVNYYTDTFGGAMSQCIVGVTVFG